MRLKSYCTRQRRIILTNWESKSSPLSNLSGRNTPIFWNKNGKPILPISRPKMIWKNFIMFGPMWNIYWRFLPRHNRSAAQKNPVNKVCLLFAFSVPTECAAIATGNDFRGLGICHQQAFSRNSGNGISAKYAILRKIALLASSLAPCIDILSSLVLYCYTQQHNS